LMSRVFINFFHFFSIKIKIFSFYL
jgi:hypothetical protein